MIRKAKKKDIPTIAHLHAKELSGDFLSSLGKRFIENIYISHHNSPFAHLYVIEDKGLIRGFIFAHSKSESFYTTTIKKRGIQMTYHLLMKIFMSPMIIISIIETIKYMITSSKNSHSAELFSIVIDSTAQRSGFGSQLLRKLETDLKKRRIKSYIVTTLKKYSHAQNFYKKNSFNPIGEFKLYGKKWLSFEKKLV